MGNINVYEKVKERLIRYAKIDTQSQPYSGHWPTTEKQKDLAIVLKKELIDIGVSSCNLM